MRGACRFCTIRIHPGAAHRIKRKAEQKGSMFLVGCDVRDERYSVRVFKILDTDKGSCRETAVK